MPLATRGQEKSRVEVFFIDAPAPQSRGNRVLADSSTRPPASPNLLIEVYIVTLLACEGVWKRSTAIQARNRVSE